MIIQTKTVVLSACVQLQLRRNQVLQFARSWSGLAYDGSFSSSIDASEKLFVAWEFKL